MKVKRALKNILPYCFVKKYSSNRTITNVTSIEPKIYNKYGELMRVFYLKDNICTHSPYTFSSQNNATTNTILWDRFNECLPIHFYTHKDMFRTLSKNKNCFGLLLESETIVPEDYDYLLNHPGCVGQFKAIFTHSQRLIEKYDNAKFIPGSSVWYGGTAGGGKLDEFAYKKKCKNISLVSSNKAQCELHQFRIKLASMFFDSKIVDVMGTFNGGKFISIEESLREYRYSIVIENNITDCYFTEKLLNCFASMTVPIYIGAKKISNYFDEEGIITIDPSMSDEEILDIINRCNEEDYKKRYNAIMYNYKESKKYECIEDFIFTQYKNLF